MLTLTSLFTKKTKRFLFPAVCNEKKTHDILKVIPNSQSPNKLPYVNV